MMGLKKKDQRLMSKDQRPMKKFGLRSAVCGLWSFFRFPIFMFLCFCALLSFSAAQDISFQANVDSTKVSLGGYIRLTLTVTGTPVSQPVELPRIEGFQSRYIGPSTRVSIVNGRQSSAYAFIYNLYPQKTGYFIIPVIETTIDGKTYATQPINVQVVSEQSSQGGSAAISESLEERLFLVLGIPQENAFVSEKIPVMIRLYIHDLSVRDIEFPPEMNNEGFLMDEFKEPRQGTQILNGIKYSVVEFETAVYPLRSGELELGPANLKCSLLLKSQTKDRFGSFGFFDEDFFSGFFDAYTTRPLVVNSKPVTVHVRDLPQEDKPSGFSGAVGKFLFEVNISPREVKVGDPVTVRMKVEGQGSLKTFDLPAFQNSDDLKVYDPQVKEENGIKTLEQVVIPRRQGKVVLPAVAFSFFDTQQQSYQTISRGPTELDVKPLAEGQQLRVVGIPDDQGRVIVREDTLGRDISFIKEHSGRLYSGWYRAWHSAFFIGLTVFLLLGWAAACVTLRFAHKIRTDEGFARRLQAPRYARKGLGAVKVYLEKNQPDVFYDTLFKTLQVYFSHKFHIPPGAVSVVEIRRILDQRRIAADSLADVTHIFSECEAARYAALGFSRDQMSLTYEKARRVIDWFERKC